MSGRLLSTFTGLHCLCDFWKLVVGVSLLVPLPGARVAAGVLNALLSEGDTVFRDGYRSRDPQVAILSEPSIYK